MVVVQSVHPIKASRGISAAETELRDMFRPNDLSSVPENEYVLHHTFVFPMQVFKMKSF